MDIEKLEQAKKIQRKLIQLRHYMDNFPQLHMDEYVVGLLYRDFNDYKENAWRTLSNEVALLEQEFKQL